MNIDLLTYTPTPEKIIAESASLCYKENRIMTDEECSKLIIGLKKRGHMSPFEHTCFTFRVNGISRACSHQLVRHRLASYTQASQRYSDTGCYNFITPDSLINSKIACRVDSLLVKAKELYGELVAEGVSKEDARYVLPQAVSTSIVVTMNARELLHFLELRTDTHAQWEIRNVALEIKRIVAEVAPTIFN